MCPFSRKIKQRDVGGTQRRTGGERGRGKRSACRKDVEAENTVNARFDQSRSDFVLMPGMMSQSESVSEDEFKAVHGPAVTVRAGCVSQLRGRCCKLDPRKCVKCLDVPSNQVSVSEQSRA